MTFVVRQATLEDLDSLVTFTMAEAYEAEGHQGNAATIRQGVGAGLRDPAIARYWLLEETGGGRVGSISIVREWSDWKAAYYWWIQSLYITPEYRGRDLLALLLEAVQQAAREENALALRLYAYQENARAIRAYRREGFSDTPYQIMEIDLTDEK